mgnify:CR=1 FL=1
MRFQTQLPCTQHSYERGSFFPSRVVWKYIANSVSRKQAYRGSTNTASKTLFPLGDGDMERLPSSETEEKRFRESRSFRRFFSSMLSNSTWRGKASTSLKKSICDLDQRSCVLAFPDSYKIKHRLIHFRPFLPIRR